MQRLECELGRAYVSLQLTTVIAPHMRTDVQADPTLLSRNERETLKEWEMRRDKLSVLEMRVEEAVFILRDLSIVGPDEE